MNGDGKTIGACPQPSGGGGIDLVVGMEADDAKRIVSRCVVDRLVATLDPVPCWADAILPANEAYFGAEQFDNVVDWIVGVSNCDWGSARRREKATN